ncbi:DUF6968 family protein [Planctomicrobium sp. SH664]|uniref:DUF6968 family protein n=1 Tax=Planctomicrobium sp. SH664 TaxID=3448125 RepID=UPI003F5CAF0F
MTSEKLIAQRRLVRKDSDGIPVTVRLFLPTELEDGRFLCRFEFDGAPNMKVELVPGPDAFSALIYALFQIGEEVYRHHDLVWELTMQSPGFPFILLTYDSFGEGHRLKLRQLLDDYAGTINRKK